MQTTTISPETSNQFIESFYHFPDAAFTLDTNYNISSINTAFTDLLGYTSEEVIGNSILHYVADKDIFYSCKASLDEAGECRDQETHFIKQDGSHVIVSKSVRLVSYSSSDSFKIIVCLRDLTETYRLNTELSVLTTKLQQANTSLKNIIAEGTYALNDQVALLSSYKNALDTAALVQKYTVNKSIVEVSPLLLSRSGYKAEDLIGKPWSFMWDEVSKSKIQEIVSFLEQGKYWFGMLVCISSTGNPIYLESSIIPIFDSSNQLREIVNLSYDASYLVQTTESLKFRLNYDALTGLANRHKLLSDISSLTSPTQLVLLNIDSFNELNSYYGHIVADTILSEMAKFLSEEVKDKAIKVYKLPVDEFALVVTEGWTSQELEDYIAQLLDKLIHQKIQIKDQLISVGITAGLSSSDALGSKVKNVFVAADMALKLAKRQRKPYVFYAPALNIQKDYEYNLSWTKKLHQALEEDRIVPFFQPIVNSATLEVEYYESLIRIVDEDGTVISPADFLGVAKKIKVYPLLTKTVITKSFASFIDKDVSLSINISIEDIADPVMCSWIIEQVKNYPNSDKVIFEIVESEGIHNYEEVNNFITRVKKHGVRIAIDDFGAGYSNFIYIMRLDIDYLKIDGSIIHNIYEDKSSQIITETLVNFAKKMGIKTVAEFVSDDKVYDYVKNLELDGLQGYLFGKPSQDIT